MTELGSQHFRTLNEIMYLDKIIKAAKSILWNVKPQTNVSGYKDIEN